MPVNYELFQNVELAVTAYASERHTHAKLVNSTALVTAAAEIDTTGESFIGQMRWIKPVEAVINNASPSNSQDGVYSTLSTDIATYVKAMRSTAINQVNLSKLVTGNMDGIKIFGDNFAINRAKDEDDAISSVLKGVAANEAARGPGIVDIDAEHAPTSATGAARRGFYVDLNAEGMFGDAATAPEEARGLLDAARMGGARGERLFRAIGAAWKDYEADYYYFITTPGMLADLRAANLIDDDRITDGNLQFQTIFNGKFRLIQSRLDRNVAPSASVNALSTKTSFIALPGCIGFKNIDIETPTEMARTPKAYGGGGTTEMWYRWAYIAHPRGYTWAGADDRGAENVNFTSGASWVRKVDPLNLSILPIFHS